MLKVMFIKDRTFKIVNILYIIFSSLLGIILIYAIINTMVSLKYETEKELLNYYSNPASDYIKQSLLDLYVFLGYLLLNIIYIWGMGHVKLKKTKL